MNRNVLEFRPIEGNSAPFNNPLNNLFTALVTFLNSEIESRVNEEVKKRLSEIGSLTNAVEPQSEPQYLKAKELGKILKFAESTINDMADRGEIPCEKHTKGKKTFRRFELTKVVAALKS